MWIITLLTTLSQFHPYIAFLFIPALRHRPTIRSHLSKKCQFLIRQCILRVPFTSDLWFNHHNLQRIYPSIQKNVGFVSILLRNCDLTKWGSTERDRKLPTVWNVCWTWLLTIKEEGSVGYNNFTKHKFRVLRSWDLCTATTRGGHSPLSVLYASKF
jgi:hypothetical protein